MKITLNKDSDWKNQTANTIELKYKDQDQYTKDNLDIHVFGYPYHITNNTWQSASDIYQLYLFSGEKLHEQIDGIFTIIVIDSNLQKLIVITDPYKLYSLYFSYSDSSIMISTKLENIIDKNNFSINEYAIIEILHFGFQLGNKTILKGISRFDNGSVYIFDNTFTLNKIKYFNFNKKGKKIYTKEDYLEAFNENVRRGMTLGNKISLPMTAGLDSRDIFSAALTERSKLRCYTHGQPKSTDSNMATNICREFSVPHSLYNLASIENIENIVNRSEVINSHFEGMQNCILFSHLVNSYSKEADLADTFFPGIGGELIRNYYLPEIKEQNCSKEVLADALRQKIQTPIIAGIFKKSENEIISILNTSILKEFNDANSDDNEFLCEYFYLNNRIGNFASHGIRLCGKYFQVFIPFLSKDLLNITPNLEAGAKIDASLQKYIIKQNNNKLTGFRINHFEFFNNGTISRLKSLVYKLRYYLMKSMNVLFLRNIFKIDASYYDTWLPKYHKDYFLNKTLENIKLCDIFVSKELDSVINNFCNGKLKKHTTLLTNIFSLDLGLQELLRSKNISRNIGKK